MRPTEHEKNGETQGAFTAGADQNGQRLDAALSVLFPSLGLRARRRLWNYYKITVDGREATPGFMLAKGQIVRVKGGEAQPSEGLSKRNEPKSSVLLPELVQCEGDFCALYKPAGLPSAYIAGKPGPSAEKCLQDTWTALRRGKPEAEGRLLAPRLCNRLDTPTSGLLLAAFSDDAFLRFRLAEEHGLVVKLYYAFVYGYAPKVMLMNMALDTARRAKTRVLKEADPDPARHTAAKMLAYFPEGPVADYCGAQVSLLQVSIRRGARHQIRAHLADAGFPIVGDALYAPPELCRQKETTMYLHHFYMAFEGFSATCAPRWELWKNLPNTLPQQPF